MTQKFVEMVHRKCPFDKLRCIAGGEGKCNDGFKNKSECKRYGGKALEYLLSK